MKFNLAQARAERDQLAQEAAELNARFKEKPMPAAESTKLDGLLSRIDDLDIAFRAHDREMQEMAGGMAGDKPGNEAGPPVLRNAADFRRFYGRVSGMPAAHRDFDIADFVRGVAGMATTPGVRAALTTGTDSQGGFTVPALLMPGVMTALAAESSLMAAGAGIVPLDDGAKTYTMAGISTLPTATWRLENGVMAESEPTFRAVVSAPKSLAFRFVISRELLADGRNLRGAMDLAIGQAFAVEMDRAGLRGTGTNPEPRGLLNTVGVQAVGNGTNGASLATTRYANFFTGLQAVLSANGPAPMAAIMAPRSRVTLANQLDSTGQPLEVPPMLREMKMIATSQIPVNLTVGSSVDCSEIFLGTFENLVFTLREPPSIQLLDQLYAGTGQVGFMCHARVDVAVLRPSVFAVVTGVRA